jgi:hypothetical protein
MYTSCAQADDTECLKGLCQKLVWSSVGGDCDAANGVLCLGGLLCNPVGGPGKCEVLTPPAPTLAADCK